MYTLYSIDTEIEGSVKKEIIVGNYSVCFSKFLNLCSFSFSNHKIYSFIHYTIELN